MNLDYLRRFSRRASSWQARSRRPLCRASRGNRECRRVPLAIRGPDRYAGVTSGRLIVERSVTKRMTEATHSIQTRERRVGLPLAFHLGPFAHAEVRDC